MTLSVDELRRVIRLKNQCFDKLCYVDAKIHKQFIRCGSVPDSWHRRRDELWRQYGEALSVCRLAFEVRRGSVASAPADAPHGLDTGH